MFSILLPAYKAAFLEKAIASVLGQSFGDFELVIVNDASPEDLDTIVARFADPRIRYYRNERNVGGKSLVANWNICLGYATRDLTVLFSDDDIMGADFLLEMERLAGKYPSVDVFYSRVAVIDEAGGLKSIAPASPEYESCLDFIWHRENNHRLIYTCNFAFRKQALERLGGFVDFPLAWGSDAATWFALARTKGIVSTDRVLSYWRWSGFNISNIGSAAGRLEGLEMYRRWLQHYVDTYIPEDDIQAFLKADILRRLPVSQFKNQCAVMDRVSKHQSMLKTTRMYFSLRKRYHLSVKTLGYALTRKFIN